MSVNLLIDKAKVPSDELVEAALGESWAFFDELRALTASCEQDWRYYGKKYGWKLKIHADGKTLLELTVAEGWFLVAMAIRERERQNLEAEPADGPLAEIVAAAFTESYAIKLEVRDRASCERAKTLASFIKERRDVT